MTGSTCASQGGADPEQASELAQLRLIILDMFDHRTLPPSAEAILRAPHAE